MSEFRSVGRSSSCQSVSISLLMLIVSSGLINTSPTLTEHIFEMGCNPRHPLIKPVVLAVGIALEKGVPLVKEYIKKELGREYQDAMGDIPVCAYKSEFRAIEGIPKIIGTPTPDNNLDQINEKETIAKLLQNLHTVHLALVERKSGAADMKIPSEITMFTNLNEENELVKHAVLKLLAVFDVKSPELPDVQPKKEAENKIEHLQRNWIVLHDYILLMEYINEVSRYILKKYCGETTSLINAVLPQQLDVDIKRVTCNPKYPVIEPVIDAVEHALSLSVPMITNYTKEVLQREYKHAMRSIHGHRSAWAVIQNIPKEPFLPTPDKFLNQMNDTDAMENLFKNVLAIIVALVECKTESYAMKLYCDVELFIVLHEEYKLVQLKLETLLSVFKGRTPKAPQLRIFELAGDKNAHKMRNWVTLHDSILLLEYTDDVARHLLKKYCNKTRA